MQFQGGGGGVGVEGRGQRQVGVQIVAVCHEGGVVTAVGAVTGGRGEGLRLGLAGHWRAGSLAHWGRGGFFTCGAEIFNKFQSPPFFLLSCLATPLGL